MKTHNPTQIWDAHTHFFPEKLFNAIFAFFKSGYGVSFPHLKNTPEELISILNKAGTTRAFLLVYAHKPGISSDLNTWLHNFCHTYPMFEPLGCAHPHDPDLQQVLEQALDGYGFIGLKMHYLIKKMRADNPDFDPIYKALDKRGKLLVTHVTNAPLPEKWLGLDTIRDVLEKYPHMLVQIAHLGHYELDNVVRLMEEYQQLYLDTAWALGNEIMPANLTTVRDIILSFPERILYGTDFPITPENPDRSLQKIKDLNLPANVLQAILWDNATQLLARIKTT